MDAGHRLVQEMTAYRDQQDAIVLALPRGGVITGQEISRGLNIPLDVTCPRKIGVPFNPEVALGAVTETGQGMFNHNFLQRLGIQPKDLEEAVEEASNEAARRALLYRKDRPPLNLQGKTVILVDDGLATGATMKAAIVSVKAQSPKKVIVAVPVSPPDTLQEIRQEVDEIFCLHTPLNFQAVGQFYQNFGQTTDAEVIKILSDRAVS